MKYFKSLVVFFLLFTFSLLAESLPHTDDFEGSSNGWSYDAGGSSVLELRNNSYSTKIYNFGIANANKTVTVSFAVNTKGGWENSGGAKDYFFTRLNNNSWKNFSIVNTNNYYVNYSSKLDATGRLKINFVINVSYPAGEYAEVQYVTIKDVGLETLIPSGERNFTLFKQNSIRGNITLIGNSVKLDANGAQCAPNGTNNNNITATYADKDTDPNTFNSTSADLILPANVKGKDILYAMLYWQGRTNNSVDFGNQERSIKIKMVGETNYTPLRSINSKFNWISSDYQGITDVTNIIKTSINDSNQTDIELNGYNEHIWIADIFAPRNNNGFGAWALAVVYEDGQTLRNISTYDGYKSVYNETIRTDLTGFLTPTTGNVDSNFYIFAGEGDITLRDSVTLTNKNGNEIALGNNIFKSAVDIDGVRVTTRNPACQNTIGSDIRTFSVGTNTTHPIIGNSQTSTTIKLTSNGDLFVPGFYAFSTELYEPRVCYFIDTIVSDSNVTIFEDKAFIEDVEADTAYTFNIWISNMKKVSTDTNLETAELVQVYTNMTDFEYESSSTHIKNIGANNFSFITDNNDSDIGEFLSDQNSSKWRVGAGATSSQGGTLVPALNFNDNARKAFIKFKGKLIIEDDNATSINLLDYLEFKASFQTDTITIGENNAQKLVQCTDINASGGVSPLLGAFNAVDTGKGTASMTIGTKIVEQSFNVDIISLDTLGTTLSNHAGDVEVHLISGLLYTNAGCSDSDTACKQTACDGATSLKSLGNVTFSGTNREPLSVVYDKAIANASFQIIYNSGTNTACSTDNFAIRPKKFSLSFNPLTLAKAENKSIRYVAENALNSPTQDYNEALTGLAITSDLADPAKVANCTNNNLNLVLPAVNFTNGVVSNNSVLSRVGVFNIVMKEIVGSEYAVIDAGDTPEATRLIEKSDVDFTILPDRFSITPLVNVNNEGNFTYLSNDLAKMAVKFDIDVTALNSAGATTPNYDEDCFANPINVDINYTVVSGTMPTNIMYSELTSNIVGNNTATDNTLTLPKVAGDTLPATLFTNANSGVASLQLRANFQRRVDTTLNPFRVNFNDIGVSDQTQATLIISNELDHAVDLNATMVYGRTNVARARFQANASQQAFINYEIFCDGVDASGTACTKTLLPNGNTSSYSNDPRWFVNSQHTVLSGTAGAVNQKGFTPRNGAIVLANGLVTQDLNPATGHLNTVLLSYDATTKGNPYKTTMENNASLWLVNNRFDNTDTRNEFEVEFEGPPSAWAGKHDTTTTTNRSGTEKVNRRSMW